jgi:hypothetical protein
MQASRPWRNALLSVHVISTVGVLGMDLVLLVLGLAGLAGTAPATVYPAASLVGSTLVGPLVLVALATGLLLGTLTPYRLLRYWWTAIKLAITAGLTAAVYLVLLPGLRSAADASLAGEEIGSRLALAVAPVAASSLLVLAVALAVFKPGWLIPARPGAAPQIAPSGDRRPSAGG